MKHLAFALWIACGLLPTSRADDYPRNPDIDVLHYLFNLSLTDQSDAIRGSAAVTIRFTRDDVAAFELDLVSMEDPGSATGMTVQRVRSGDAPAVFTHRHDRLRIETGDPVRVDDRRTYTIDYHGVPADGLVISKNKHGDRTFFGDNFPNRARHWLPTLDHPYDKATCEFAITAPVGYQVIASGVMIEETDLAGALRRTHWRSTVPLSSYLMVIGVARFAVQTVEVVSGIPIQTWVYTQDREAGFHDFARAGRVLDFFAAHIGPYPYAKLANVQSRTRWGGMENAGNIFYAEDSVRGTRRVEGTMTHEIAHQWFGDSVTTADWNHVWLSEGFATYFTQLFNEFTFGRDRMVEGMKRARARVFGYFKEHADARIVDPAIPVSEILSPYSYQKGAWVLHTLRREIGDELFWKGVRAYYKRYRDGNALSADFRRVMEEVSGRELGWFFDQWLYQPGHPRFRGHWLYDRDAKALLVTLEQTQDEPSVFRTKLDVGIRVEGTDRLRVETLDVRRRKQTFTLTLDAPPVSVDLDPGTWLLMEADFHPR